MTTLAGVRLDPDLLDGLAMTVAMPDCPIYDCETGKTETPGDDLLGYLARSLNLDPAELTDKQRAEIEQFITDYTL
jgi:hypothetical protein